MRSIPLIPVLLAALLAAPAYAKSEVKEAKAWCNDAHMQKMESMIGKMTDAAKKSKAETYLAMSKTAMENKDMSGCVSHMKEAHTAMGL